MKNLEPYKDEYFEIHCNSVNSKENADLIIRLEAVKDEIEIRYNEYKSAFDSNSLELINNSTVTGQLIDDLKSLYGYQKAVIKKLRKNIDDNQIMAIRGTCQNCSINAVNTMDHYLPESKYPEFTVNPLNLFPSCGECNGYKSSNWKEDGVRIFLNLYLDKLPEIRYLKIDLALDDNNLIDVTFKLDLEAIPVEYRLLIKNQYEKLNLFDRMKKASNEVITYTENSLRQWGKKLPLDIVIETIVEQTNDERKIFGFNHWKSLLTSDLAQSDLFHQSIGIK